MGLAYFIRYAPTITAGIEKGTNKKKIFQLMCFLKKYILEAELVNVPIVKATGIAVEVNNNESMGINTKLAPPPQMALIQKATMVATKSNRILKITISFSLNEKQGHKKSPEWGF